jgi:SAM-dependent methyltransferase
MRLRRLRKFARRLRGAPQPGPAASWDPSRPRPLSSLAEPEWLAPLAFKGGHSPFDPLSPAAQHARTPIFTRLDDLPELGDLDARVARDPLPIPSTDDRLGYHGARHFDWWLSGLRDHLLAQRALACHGQPLQPGDAVFELGCSTGRALRHWLQQEDGLDVWGGDLDLRAVEWLRTYLPVRARVFQNTALPHLPLEDRSLSLVTAYSVFTHIDELELAWIAELRRVLRPGGLALLSVHSERTWAQMQPGWPVRDALWRNRARICEHRIDEGFLQRPLPAPRAVFWWESEEGRADCDVFHSQEYLRGAWARFFEVVEVVEQGHSYQDLVVLRRK